MKRILFAFGFVVFLMMGTNSAFAATQACAIITGGSAGGLGVGAAYLGNQSGQDNEGCNVLVTFNANGSIVTTHPNTAISYDDGLDDNLIGIVNNSGHAITNVTLSSAQLPAIFSFEGDGVCDPTWTFSPLGPSGPGTCSGAGYAPAGVTFSGVSANEQSGTVNFGGGGIANGATGFFSLEGPVALDLVVTTPEPSSLLLLGMGLLGLGGAVRYRFKTRA